KADDGVAAFDVVVQKVERLAGVVGLQPKGDPAEIHSERIEVHSIDTSSDHVAQCRAKSRWRGLFLPGPDYGEFGGDAAGRGKQDVPRAAGGIGYAQIEQRGFRFVGFEALGDQGVEG